MITAAQFLRVVGALVRLNFSTGKDRACVRAHLRRCLYTVDSLKRLTHTVTHTRKRADGSSGNRDVEEYFNSSENDQKRPENDIAVAKRLNITATTLDGILTVNQQGRHDV